MTELLLPLNKVLVKEYYRLNTAFFLLVITLAFGFMSGTEHRALAEYFISSPIMLSIPLALWWIYLVKIINFNRSQGLLPQNQFLYTLSLLPRTPQLIVLFISVAEQFMPAIAYGAFLMMMALKNNQVIPIVAVPGAILLFLVAGTVLLFRQLHYPIAETKVSTLKKFLDDRITKPLIQFYLEWILRHEPALGFGTKLFAGVLIFGVAQLYHNETYDVRLMAMVTTLAFSANFTIISRIHYFENRQFELLRNLPIPILKRLGTFVVVFTILCLPETVMLIKYFPLTLSWMEAPVLILYGISIGIFFYGAHFAGIQPSNSGRLIFGLFITWIVLILFRMPVVAIALANGVAGVWLLKYYFYRFSAN